MSQIFQYDEFTSKIVLAITGVEIDNISLQTREITVVSCQKTFLEYVLDYFKRNYAEVDTTRLNLVDNPTANIFGKFPDIESKLLEAYQSFLNQIKSSWN